MKRTTMATILASIAFLGTVAFLVKAWPDISAHFADSCDVHEPIGRVLTIHRLPKNDGIRDQEETEIETDTGQNFVVFGAADVQLKDVLLNIPGDVVTVERASNGWGCMKNVTFGNDQYHYIIKH